MLRPPPSSTLFPYTTLFRSHWWPLNGFGQEPSSATAPSGRLHLGASWDAADRKSTRLNSSHQIISYAVFCLKKKKTFVTLATNVAQTFLPTHSFLRPAHAR